MEDEEIISSIKAFMKMGIYACPEAASTLAALKKLENTGMLDKDERMLLCITGNVMKYFDIIKLEKDKIPVLPKEADSLD